MSSQGLAGFESSTQLEMMNRLRVLDIAKYIEFPQIAAVGDQSSGKSSILESISGFSFPRDSGLCTRSVTQFIFRLSEFNSVSISIIPGPNRSEQKAKSLREFTKQFETLSDKDFLEVFSEVCSLMEIPGPGQALLSGQSAFSEDTLCIQICGPDRQNLSMIDIPGIFRDAEEGKTTEDDIALVRKLMYRHISDERTIILAVIPSNVDIATQEILKLAKEVDPKGIRTLGVLTKPDLVDEGAEENIMRLVQGKNGRLKLGWCICRNRGQAEMSIDSAARDKKEALFFTEKKPWSSLDKSRVGTPALQKLLRNILIDITRREFPKVKAQVGKQLSECFQKLTLLGKDRETPDQQREFLQSLALQFQDITSSALDAHYSRHKVLTENKDLRLATINVAFNERFSQELNDKGHTASFNLDDTEDLECQAPSTPEEPIVEEEKEESKEEGDDLKNSEITDYKRILQPYKNIPGLVGVAAREKMLGNWPLDLSIQPKPELFSAIEDWNWSSDSRDKKAIGQWIAEEYKAMRGFGLTAIGPSILPTIWKAQSKDWELITLNYVGHVILSVAHFIREIMDHICPDEQIRMNIMGALEDELSNGYQKATEQAKFLINVESNGTMLTSNHYFNENLQRCRTDRLENMTKGKSWKTAEDKEVISLKDLRTTMDNADHTVRDIHDIVKSYYKVARKRFVDNICLQVSDHYLLCGPMSPLRVFNTSFVSGLTHVQLDRIAGEDDSTKQLRKTLKEEIKALEEGKKLLNG